MFIIFLTILAAFLGAVREVIDLGRNTDSLLYTWHLFGQIDAFHTYPAIKLGIMTSIFFLIGHYWANQKIAFNRIFLFSPIWFFCFYQVRNLFMHELLPLSVPDSMDLLQWLGLGIAIIVIAIYFTKKD